MFHRFMVFSGFGALANLATGYFLYGYLGFNGLLGYPVSVAAAFVAGMGVSLILNRTCSHDPAGRLSREMLYDFVLVSIGGLALTIALAGLFLKAAQAGLPENAFPLPNEFIAHVLAVGLTAFYSFFAHKHFSFRRIEEAAPSTVTQTNR